MFLPARKTTQSLVSNRGKSYPRRLHGEADQRPKILADDPDEEFIASIAPDVLSSLQARDFFARLDDVFCPPNSITGAQVCSWDFRHAKATLQHCGFEESDWSEVFHVLMGQGAFCECEILYNVATQSRLKSQHWQHRAHEIRT